MRLREIQKALQENISGLSISVEQIPNSNPVQFLMKGISEANKSIHNLEGLHLFNSEILKLKASSFYNNPNNEIKLSQQEYPTIQNAIAKVKQNSLLLLEALNSALGSNSLSQEQTISIKIKEIKDLDELTAILEGLKRVIQLPLSEFEEGGQLKIENFDSGSFWLDILLPSTASVTLIGTIAWAGAVIYRKYREAFAFNQYAEGLEIQKEYLQSLKDAAKSKIDLDIEAEARLIQNEFFSTDDNEQLNRLKLSIKEYSELIQKGVQIQPALTAPEKITNLFPNYKTMELIESKIKHLPDAN